MIHLNTLFVLLTFQSAIVSCYPGSVNQQDDEMYPVAIRSSQHPSPLSSLQNAANPLNLIFNQAIKKKERQDQNIYFKNDEQNSDDIKLYRNNDTHIDGREKIEVIEQNSNNENVGRKDNLSPLKKLSEIIARPVGHLIKLATNKQEKQSDKIVFTVEDENDFKRNKYDNFTEQEYNYEKNELRDGNKISECMTGNGLNRKETENESVANINFNKLKNINDITRKNENNNNITKPIEIDLNTIDDNLESTTESTTEFTTTEDYETTTLDDLDNRAGVPGPVIASLLG